MAQTLFYVLAGVTLAAAILVVTLRNLFHCALFLAVAMFGVAGIFIYLDAEFLAAVQVLIYVGAVTVLIIFGIMLTRNVMDARTRVMNRQALLSVLVALALVTAAYTALGKSEFSNVNAQKAVVAASPENPASAPVETSAGQKDLYALGPELLQPEKGFVFAFELVSVLLLSALVGAIVIARKEPE